MDKISVDRIAKLHPRLRDEALKILQEVEIAQVGIRITQTLRTIKEQNDLYAQGRTKPGKIVTKAKGGQSPHNFGLACDFILYRKDGSISYNMKEDLDKDGESDWMEVVAIFKKYGWTWGGDFKSFKDFPHFEKTFGKSLAELRAMKTDKDGYVIF